MKHAPVKKKTAIAAAPKVKKSPPKSSAKTIKNVAKKAVVSTVRAKPKNRKPAVAVVQAKVTKNKLSAAAVKNKIAPDETRANSVRSAKTSKAEVFVKTGRVSAAKTRTFAAVKKTRTAAPKTRVSIKETAKRALPPIVAAVEKLRGAKVQPIASAKKNKSAGAPVKSAVSARGKAETAPAKPVSVDSKRKTKSVKSQAIVVARKTEAAKSQPIAAPKKVKKVEPKISAAKSKRAKTSAGAPVKAGKVSVEEIKSGRRKLAAAATTAVKLLKTEAVANAASETQGQKIFAAVKIRRQKIVFSPKIAAASAGKMQSPGNGKTGAARGKNASKTVENKIEPIESALLEKPKKRKAKAIGAAVFRGKKERYDFQVFPLEAEFDAMAQVSGIYVISKRKTDRNKRAHHALVCIGQTDSVAGEIKRHAKRCIKKHQANVISILAEDNEKRRLKIEEDLKSAHSVACGAE